jgi:hypothetical protein
MALGQKLYCKEFQQKISSLAFSSIWKFKFCGFGNLSKLLKHILNFPAGSKRFKIRI